MKSRNSYFWAGVFFVMLQLVAVVRNLYFDFIFFFWFCDFIPIFLALAFFLKKDDVIKGVVNIGLFLQLIYVFSFIVRVVFGISVLEDVDFVLDYNFLIIFSSVALHLATIVAFVLVCQIKSEGKSLEYSVVLLFFTFVAGIFFTSPVDDINYVFFLSNFFGLEILVIFWIPIAFFVLVVPTYLFQKVICDFFYR